MEQQEEKRAKSEIDLRKLMRKLGMGTTAFSAACGVSTQAMSQYLRPNKSITTATIYNIAKALDIDPREMFFPTDKEEEKQEDNSLFAAADNIEQHAVGQGAEPQQPIQTTTAFCPHCGAKVRVVVVLLAE